MQADESAIATLAEGGNDAAYVLREVIDDIPLSADGPEDNVFITCVEYWGMTSNQTASLNPSSNMYDRWQSIHRHVPR